MALAIFDLDNTLIHGDSDYEWGQFLCTEGLVDPDEHTKGNQKFYNDYEQGTLDIYEYVNFSVQPLKEKTLDELIQIRTKYLDTVIEGMILPKALEQLNKHRNDGDKLLIISATNSFLVAPIAKRLGVQSSIGIDLEIINDHFTGNIVGTPSFKEGKITRLHEWLETHPEYNLEGSYFYSDSHNDIPLLEQVTHAIATNPDPTLTEHAKTKGWTMLDLVN